MRTAAADYETPEGKQLLDQHFPEVRWKSRPAAKWIKVVGCSIGALISAILIFAVDGAGLKLLMAGFLAVCAFPIYMIWTRHHGGEFVLRPDALSYTGWVRPLRFAEIATLTTDGSTVTFHLKANAPVIWKASPLRRMKTRTVALELGLIPGKSQETLATLARYISRQVQG